MAPDQGYFNIYEKGADYMKKAMISQRYSGRSKEEIMAERDEAVKKLESLGYEAVNVFFTDEWNKFEALKKYGEKKNVPLFFYSLRMEALSNCDAIYFCKGWEYDCNCKMDHEAALIYGIRVLYD